MIDVDVAGSIGRRYRRQDEVGTPLCVTVDFDTLDDRAVTIRDRDTMSQERVPIDGLLGELEGPAEGMSDENYYEELGVEPGASRDELREAHRQRVADLEAAREKKNVSESQLAGQPRRGRARAGGVERALRPVPAPALRRAARRPTSEPSGEVELVDDDDVARRSRAAPSSPAGASCSRPRRRRTPAAATATATGNGNGKGAGAAHGPQRASPPRADRRAARRA